MLDVMIHRLTSPNQGFERLRMFCWNGARSVRTILPAPSHSARAALLRADRTEKPGGRSSRSSASGDGSSKIFGFLRDPH